MEDEMKQSDVLIIGAGPTGLVLALWLTKLAFELSRQGQSESPPI